ncbi:MAG: endopeptidase La [Alphaproteobacteria bacterium]|nr:endopeptidase La [Alphaproteobacteria bacterium]
MLGSQKKSDSYPVLPLRDIVVFPHMIVPLFVGREKSVHALEHVMQEDKHILLVTQKSPSEDDPGPSDLHRVGTVGTILQLLKLPDGTVKVLVEGGQRMRISSIEDDPQGFLKAGTEAIADSSVVNEELEALARAAMAQFEQYVKLNKKIPPEVIVAVNQIEEPSKMADTIASHLALKIDEKQELLEIADTSERLERIYGFMEGEIGVLQVEKRIRNRVKRQMEKTQREYYLNEQMKAIQKELGEGEGFDELDELDKKISETKLSKEAREKAQHELKKLRQMSPMSAEATVVRNYLDWILSVPWDDRTKVKKDIKDAKKVLDKDHYGLERVKERILEYLAVQNRTRKVKGPILCLVGPPGVGKTSLGQSIARATGRNFVRVSLGGVRDESEIRGHRRTYIGAMPGKIIQGMKKAKSSNPLFLLDEVDKLGSDWRGDPSSALLEVLDPEQNSTFQDHYLELEYDLSDVMFICTANTLNLPQPLLDRMEIIRISGYTEDEKLEIVKRHLLDKQKEAAGLKKGEFSVNDAALRTLIRLYTREAGVRNLEREIANLCRKAIKDILMKGRKKVPVTARNLGKYAGVPKYRYGEIEEQDRVGLVNGLAYTDFGGDLLSIEAVTMPGKEGKVTTTGNLRDVMKESITVAEMLTKSRAARFGINFERLNKTSIHVHVPEGAIPKDGPSAGAAMTTAIISALTGIEVRKDIAMTGEVNLRGYVTAIGGLKEKLLAALRGGIKKVLIPSENEKDLPDIPDKVKKGLEIIPVRTIEEVLSHALVSMPEPLETDSGEEIEPISSKSAENKGEEVIRH